MSYTNRKFTWDLDALKRYNRKYSAIYDVSANNDGATFASLSALLSDANLDTLIPEEVRKGGMTIRFVCTSDNKYVQFRCKAQSFTTDVTQWINVEEEINELEEEINGERYGYPDFQSLNSLASTQNVYYISERPLDGIVSAVDVKVGTGSVSILRVSVPQLGGAITTWQTLVTYNIPSLLENTVVRIPLNVKLAANEYIGIKGGNNGAFYFGQAEGYVLYSNNSAANNYSAAISIMGGEGISAAVIKLKGCLEGGIIPELEKLNKEVNNILYNVDVYDESPQSPSAYSAADGYSVCKVNAGTIIKEINMCAPSGTTPILEFAELVDGVLYGRVRFTLNAGDGEEVYVKTDINYTCEKDLYIILRNGFYFKVSPTPTNPSYIVGTYRQNQAYTSQQSGTELLYKVKIVTQSIVDDINKRIGENRTDINNLESIILPLTQDYEVYSKHPVTEEAYSRGTGYSIGTVPQGTEIKSIRMCAPSGTTPILEFAELINGSLYGRAQFTLNPGAGQDTYVETSINYPCSKEMYLIVRNGFYYEVVRDTEYLTYIVGDYRENNTYGSQESSPYGFNIKATLTAKCILNSLSEQIEEINEDITEGETKNIKEVSSDIAMFENVGFCGDSYMAGNIIISDNPTVGAVNVNLCWGKILERTHGINSFIYAKGGASVVDVRNYNPWYLNDADCLPKLLNESAKNLYVISLGHNDCYISAQNPSVYGKSWTKEEFLAEFNTNYRSILSQIVAHAPDAKIILCKQSGPYAKMRYGADINATIADIGEDLGLPVLDPANDKYLSSSIYESTMVHNHPVFAGYAGIAKAFDRQFCWATVEYFDYFKGYTGL